MKTSATMAFNPVIPFRPWIILLVLVLGWQETSSAAAASTEEISKLFQERKHDRVFEASQEFLKHSSNNLEVLSIVGRSLVELGRFEDALVYLERTVVVDTNQTWAAAWALAYAGYAHYGLGHHDAARTNLAASLKSKATRNVVSFAQQAQLLLGLTDHYRDWSLVETEHFRFHFSPETMRLDTNRFAVVRELAFTNINHFFAAKLPKKIDFFVWNKSEDAEKLGLGTLGFARPEMCIVHSRYNQTVGHEMTHVISHQAFHPVSKSGFINEGIAVYFDQTRRHRLANAREAVRQSKLTKLNLKEYWQGRQSRSETLSYPVAGAFIERLMERGGPEKLKQLASDQSFESARRIYGADLDEWIATFEKELQ
jgi:tetratricopeptide (TPR) repeat protein